MRARFFRSFISARISGTRSGSTPSGASPARPSAMARSVPWPLPVKASEPCRLTLRRRARDATGATSSSRKRLAATIGPTVWELGRPMPILKMSKMLRNMAEPSTPPLARGGQQARLAATARAAHCKRRRLLEQINQIVSRDQPINAIQSSRPDLRRAGTSVKSQETTKPESETVAKNPADADANSPAPSAASVITFGIVRCAEKASIPSGIYWGSPSK